MSNINNFLKSILGDDGLSAFDKVNQRLPAMESILAPRTILSWLTTATKMNYKGEIPGLKNTYISLSKTENGVSGSVSILDGTYKFENDDMLHVASVLSVALGVDDIVIDPMLKNTDISKLGKSIDLLVKARVIKNDLVKEESSKVLLEKKVLDPALGYNISHEDVDFGAGDKMTLVRTFKNGQQVGEAGFSHKSGNLVPETVTVHPDHRRLGIASAMYHHAESNTGKTVVPSNDRTPSGMALWAGSGGKQFGKAEEPGGAAAPKKPKEPQIPVAPQAVAPSTNKPMKQVSKSFELHIKKSQSEKLCPECGIKQFRVDRFSGCMCFRSLAKTVSVEVVNDGYILSLNKSSWDSDTVQALISSLEY